MGRNNETFEHVSGDRSLDGDKLVGAWLSFLSKQLLVIRSAIPSENIQVGTLDSAPPGFGLC
jgi:hypothetical protein